MPDSRNDDRVLAAELERSTADTYGLKQNFFQSARIRCGVSRQSRDCSLGSIATMPARRPGDSHCGMGSAQHRRGIPHPVDQYRRQTASHFEASTVLVEDVNARFVNEGAQGASPWRHSDASDLWDTRSRFWKVF
jgi:hypothetical protein